MSYEGVNDYELIYRIRENDDEFALNDLIKKYEPIIISCAKRYYLKNVCYGVDLNDFIQEGRIAVVKALDSYNSDGSALFYTYVSLCINRRMITYCRYLNTSKNNMLNDCMSDEVFGFIGDGKFDPNNYLKEMYNDRVIIDYMNSLDFLDGNIFELRYNGFSYAEIGSLLDISSTTVARRLCKIKRSLHDIKDKF